ncbi:MAG: hypothetical protein IMY86_00435 [Chloroflexi bacterium]|nr:hypothetical protein [Chloroflexota bacterium]
MQTTVRPTEMVIAETQVMLAFHPTLFLGKSPGLVGEPSILMTQRAVLALSARTIRPAAL